MIVTCTTCQTRFRVPEDRIGPKGARIRCSRCQAVFVVTPQAGVSAPPPSSDVPFDDPFAPRPSAQPPVSAAGAAALDDPFAAAMSAPAAPPVPAAPVGPAPGLDAFGVPLASPPAQDPFTEADPFGGGGSGWDAFAPPPAAAPSAPPPAPAQIAPPELPDLPSAPPPLPIPSVPPPFDDGMVSESSGIKLEEPPPRPPEPDLFGGPSLDLGLAGPDAPGEVGLSELLADFGPEPQPAPSAAAPPPEVAAPPPAAAEVQAVPPEEPESAAREPSAAPAPRGRLGQAMSNSLSLVLLIAAAAALFVVWRSGFAPRLVSLFGHRTLPAIEATAIRGGMYDTVTGSAVLVVRGQVAARRAVTEPVRVQVDLLDGDRVVASASGLAGVSASPEQIFGVTAPEDVAALRRSLDEHAAPRLAAGASAPFLIVFPQPAPEPRGLELRVAAAPAQ
jgi:predicted Zn finger-like uncharacterized protein